jgi:pimeloyl-ACP methyl ester carboxylesterase
MTETNVTTETIEQQTAHANHGWKRPVLIGAAALVVGLAGLAAAQEVWRQASYAELVAHANRVDIGGRAIHLSCSGVGETTYVLEAGATGFAETWAWVQDDLDDEARVCSYDRAGMGLSDPNPEGFSAEGVAADLHAALTAAGEAGPYVMVGHSLGGLLVRDFAATYPGDVEALVLVDPSHEDQLKHFDAEAASQVRSFSSLLDTLGTASSFGLLHLYSPLTAGAEGLQGDAWDTAAFNSQNRTHLAASADEMAHWDDITDRVRERELSALLPVLVVTAGEAVPGSESITDVVPDLHADIAGRFIPGKHITIESGNHFSLVMKPEPASHLAAAIERFVARLPS